LKSYQYQRFDWLGLPLVEDLIQLTCLPFSTPFLELIRYVFREELAEAMGTFVLLTFGNAVDCQVYLADVLLDGAVKKGDYLSIAFGWGIGVGMGVWVSGGISGGHLNP